MTSEFTIVAVVYDRRAGERTFTADELRSTLADSLGDLHLEVKAIRVMAPMYESRVAQPAVAVEISGTPNTGAPYLVIGEKSHDAPK